MQNETIVPETDLTYDGLPHLVTTADGTLGRLLLGKILFLNGPNRLFSVRTIDGQDITTEAITPADFAAARRYIRRVECEADEKYDLTVGKAGIAGPEIYDEFREALAAWGHDARLGYDRITLA